ncbi:MAG: DUF1553 domain-containing protein, partial [Chitinophagaceae bacterium]
ATSREVCSARRIRTNTPLQALVTLNDSAYLDMSRNFATRMIREGGTGAEAEIRKGYSVMVYKEIPAEKLQALVKLYDRAFQHYRKDGKATKEINADKSSGDPARFAALVVVANAMMNLDDVLTKS